MHDTLVGDCRVTAQRPAYHRLNSHLTPPQPWRLVDLCLAITAHHREEQQRITRTEQPGGLQLAEQKAKKHTRSREVQLYTAKRAVQLLAYSTCDCNLSAGLTDRLTSNRQTCRQTDRLWDKCDKTRKQTGV